MWRLPVRELKVYCKVFTVSVLRTISVSYKCFVCFFFNFTLIRCGTLPERLAVFILNVEDEFGV